MTTATAPAPAKRESAAHVTPPRGLDRMKASVPADSETATIARNGGAYRAGIIRGVSLMSVGECLGHDMWSDHETLAQVSNLAAQPNAGVKSRFTHPGMSSDGLGRHLGRLKDVTTEGDQVLGDLHIQASARKTPDGDLGTYVMDLAAEDPQAAGLSIVFMHDWEAEQEFALANGATRERSGRVDWGGFRSPDPANIENFPHVRLEELRACDVVDEPAANPDGLFDRQDGPRDADAFLAFALNLDESPELPPSAFGIDPDRARSFLTSWLETHGLTISKKDPAMTTETTTPETAPAGQTREEFQAELDRYVSAFGAENGTTWFRDGIELGEAKTKHIEALNQRIEELETKLAESDGKLAAVAGSLGEDEPVDTTGAAQDQGKVQFKDLLKGTPSKN